jgi:1,4-alpha-glucan branching enzyme
VLSFIRYSRERQDFVVVICNFTPVVREGYRIGVPKAGGYRELINSDLDIYAGSGVSNGPVIDSRPEQCHAMHHSLLLTLPPLATLFLKPR